jgi:methyl acetate hydrolase
MRHFLTHTSGLGYPFTSAILRDVKPQPGENYPFGGPLLFDPGERWHYGTDVVGKLVEKVSGQKLEDYFRQHIFAPLQMADTSYNVPLVRKCALGGLDAFVFTRDELAPPHVVPPVQDDHQLHW